MSWRTKPLPKDWKRRRAKVLRRDVVCRLHYFGICTITPTEVDHIIPAVRGGGEDEANLQGVCGACHAHKSGLEARGEPRKRPPEPHPGLVTR